jgi:hypothetical protein
LVLVAKATASHREIVLYDPRRAGASDGRIDTDVSRSDGWAILDALIPSYKRNVYDCDPPDAPGRTVASLNDDDGDDDDDFGWSDGSSLGDARARGDIVPFVDSVSTGAFTRAGAKQTLYAVRIGECGAIHAEDYGTTLLAVREGKSVVARALVPGGTTVEALFDLDGDGHLEVLLVHHAVFTSVLMEYGSIVRFERGRRRWVDDFDDLLNDNCHSQFPESRRYSIVRAIIDPDAPIRFVLEGGSEDCGGP